MEAAKAICDLTTIGELLTIIGLEQRPSPRFTAAPANSGGTVGCGALALQKEGQRSVAQTLPFPLLLELQVEEYGLQLLQRYIVAGLRPQVTSSDLACISSSGQEYKNVVKVEGEPRAAYSGLADRIRKIMSIINVPIRLHEDSVICRLKAASYVLAGVAKS